MIKEPYKEQIHSFIKALKIITNNLIKLKYSYQSSTKIMETHFLARKINDATRFFYDAVRFLCDATHFFRDAVRH